MANANWIEVTKVGNSLSKADHSSLLPLEIERQKWQDVLNAEVEAGADRDLDSIGTVGYLVSYEYIASGAEAMIEMAKQARTTMEMLFKLHKPQNTLFAISASSFHFNFIESLSNENIYVLNDEHLYRGETFFLNRETTASVLDYSDVFSGIFPSNLDCICFSATDLFASSNENLVNQAFDALNVGGIMIIYDANDGMALYTQPKISPGYKVHQKLLSLSNANVYHMPLSLSFTVVTKNS